MKKILMFLTVVFCLCLISCSREILSIDGDEGNEEELSTDISTKSLQKKTLYDLMSNPNERFYYDENTGDFVDSWKKYAFDDPSGCGGVGTLTQTPKTTSGSSSNANSYEFVSDNFKTSSSKESYRISLSSDIGGTVRGSGLYKKGTKVTINAIPNTGYRFAYWIGSLASYGSTPQITLTVDKDIYAGAVFIKK